MPSILFVCTANQFRSPLAALSFCKVLAHKRPAGKWVVDSAGTWTKDGLHLKPFLVKIGDRLGIHGLEQHRSQQVNDKLMKSDLIVVMETGHKEALCAEFPSSRKRIFLLSEVADGVSYGIADPLTPDIDPNVIADKIDGLIEKGFNRIIEAAEYFEQARKASSD